MRPVTLTLVALLALLHSAAAAPPRRVAAARASRAPVIDGRLDEAAWSAATAVTRFTQRTPREGAAPDQRTELRVLYDDSAVYIGLRMNDDRPELIRRGLGRRDSPPDSDSVTVGIDPLLTGQRGYFFAVNASGVLTDGVIYQQSQTDASWDGVWRGGAAINGTGWSAELAIPFDSIAFQDAPQQSWGFFVQRYVVRNKQNSSWPALPKSSNTFVARFGRLEGLSGLRRSRSVRVTPYAAGEVQLERGDDSLRSGDTFRPNGGVDLRYAYRGQVFFHATLNPDFGHVEDDPAVVNLSPNEVYYPEKRPFFVAGAELFKTPLTLLHTRRVGARPAAPESAGDASIVELDTQARIIGAAKLTGQVGRVSLGLLSVGVLPSVALERQADGTTEERLAQGGAHYSAARVRLRLGRSSSVGVMATGLSRADEELAGSDAYAGGVDWDLRRSSGWQTTGQVTAAHAPAGTGYGLLVSAGQQGAPRWRYWVEGESFSRDYDINAVGYQWRADMVRLRGIVQRRLPSPWRGLREWNASLWGQYGMSHSDPSISFDRRLILRSWAQLEEMWSFWGGAGYRFPTVDDQESRGGPAYPRPAAVFGWIGAESNSARRVVVTVGVEGWMRPRTSTSGVVMQSELRAQLFGRLNLTLGAGWRQQHNRERWIETVEAADGSSRYLFGELDQDELELSLGGTLGLHRRLTLQVFSQLLHSVGSHDNHRELFDDSTLRRTAPTADHQGDFSKLRLTVNAALRWEIDSGTAAHLVYKLNGATDRDGEHPGFDLDVSLAQLSRQPQTHLLLFKISHGFDV